MTKPRYTYEEHMRVGDTIIKLVQTIGELGGETGYHYPKDSKFVQALWKAFHAMQEAQHEGENEALREGIDTKELYSVYWAGRRAGTVRDASIRMQGSELKA
jgi:hypothetical protein